MKHLNLLRNALIFCIPAAICLQGCEMPQQDAAFQPVKAESYEADILLEYGENESASFHLTRMGDALWDAAFSEPASLSGVILTFDGDAVSASYKGLAFTVPKSALPAKNMLGIVTEALDAADAAEALPCTQQEDGSWRYQGECSGGSYTLTFAESGEPLTFEVPAQPLKLTFSDFAVIQNTEVTEAQTETSCLSTISADQTSLTADTSVTAAVSDCTT